MTEAYTEANGIMINSGDWNGLESAVLKRSASHDRKGLWPQDGQHKLRDWVFSRQRYWGEPIPIIIVPVRLCLAPEDQLPLKLPEVEATSQVPASHLWLPLTNGSTPALSAALLPERMTPCPSGRFLLVLPALCGQPQQGKNWYQGKGGQYLPVDMYIRRRGTRVLHLLYSRFCTKFCAISALLILMSLSRSCSTAGYDYRKERH